MYLMKDFCPEYKEYKDLLESLTIQQQKNQSNSPKWTKIWTGTSLKEDIGLAN